MTTPRSQRRRADQNTLSATAATTVKVRASSSVARLSGDTFSSPWLRSARAGWARPGRRRVLVAVTGVVDRQRGGRGCRRGQWGRSLAAGPLEGRRERVLAGRPRRVGRGEGGRHHGRGGDAGRQARRGGLGGP